MEVPADPRYGSTSAGFQDAIARMQAQQAAITALEAKEAELQGIEEKGTGTTRTNIVARLDAAAAIERQTAALGPLAGSLTREIELLGANTEAWRANAIARGRSGAGAATGVGSAAASGGVVPSARAAESEARAVASLDAKLAVMQAASLASAQNVLRTSSLPVAQGALPSAERQLLGSGPVYPAGGAGTYLGQPGALRLGERPGAGAFVGGPGGLARTTTRQSSLGLPAGQFDTAAIGEYSAAEERLIGINQAVAGSIREVGAAQIEANSAFNLSVAEYAASSNALSQHGALSTEFISSFARGEATLSEFGTALTATIGKFAGWAVAGGLVYSAFEGVKRVILGAESGATGVAQLERAIPGLDKRKAVEGFREVSERVNVAPHQVAEAQFYAARAGFHSQDESLKAGETALLATKLDEVPIQDATKGLGALHIAFGINADAIRQVFNELDVGQLKFNARLNQTLPQMGRAASAFANAGGTVQQLTTQLVEVVGATGGGGGSGGGNPATFLLREAASNLVRPSAEQTIRRYGYDPKWAAQNVGAFNERLQDRAAIKPGQPGYLTPEDKSEIARAIGGGGAQGGRYGIALLNAGTSGRAAEVRAGLATAGDSSAQDLAHKKDQLNEQFHAIGYSFERLGLELGTGGATKAAEDFLSVLKLISEGLEKAAKPLGTVGHVLGEIPGPVQQLGTVAALGALATRFGRSDKALGLSKPLSEIPGLGGLNSDAKEQLRHLQRTTSEGATFATQQASRSAAANLSANYGVRSAVSEQARFAASREGQELLALPPTDTSERATALRSKAAAYSDKITTVEARAAQTNQQLLSDRELEADFAQKKAKLSDKSRSIQQRVQGAAQEDLVAATSGKPQVPLVGGAGGVGTAYEAAGGIVEEGGAKLGDSLDIAAADTRGGATAVNESFQGAALQVKEGGLQVLTAFRTLATEGALGLGVGGTRGVLGDAAGGARGIAAGGALGAGALFSGIGSKILPAFFAAYIGSTIAELAGSTIGGKPGKVVGGIGSDVAVGAGLGLLFGAPEIGAAAGGLYGVAQQVEKSEGSGFAGMIAKVEKIRKQEVEALKRQRENGGKVLSAGQKGEDELLSQSEGWQQEREVAAKGEGEAAQHAHANVEKHNKVLAARAKLFGASPQGKRVQEEIQKEAETSLLSIGNNPSNIDEYAQEIEKGMEAATKPAQATLTRRLKHAKTPAEALAQVGEFQQVIATQEKSVPAAIAKRQQELTDAQEGQKGVEDEISKLKQSGLTGGSKLAGLKKALEEDSKNVKSLGNALKTLKELAPGLQDQLKELAESGAEAGLAAADKINKTHFSLKIAEAGQNTGQRRKVEKEQESTNAAEGKKFLGKYPTLEKLREEEQKKEKVENQQKTIQEGAEKIESKGALEVAKLPVGAPKAAAAELKAKTARELEEYIKKNAKSNAFGWKQLANAEKANAEARRGAEEAINQEQQALVGLRGQIVAAADQGNAVAQAGVAVSTAQKLVGLARTQEQRLQAQLAVVNAHNQLQQALQGSVTAEGELAKSLAKNPVQAARIEVKTDQRLLGLAVGPEEREKAQATLNNAKSSLKTTLVSEREREISFQEEMKEISKQQAILQLQDLEKLHGLSKQTREELQSKIRGLEKGASSNTVFDLAPGSIKLPTAYDVHRAAGEAAARGLASNHTGLPQVIGGFQQTNTITINVKDHHDVHKVGDELERLTGGAIGTRLRKAGYRGN